MMWLVKLYPPAWRRRYGQELAELLATQPASLGTTIDLIAGAIDAWISPQSSTSEPSGGGTMLAKALQLGCIGHGPKITHADVWKSVAVTLGGTLALTSAWVWVNRRYDHNPNIDPYIDALGFMAYLIPILLSLRYTSLKGRSTRVQAVFMLGMTAILLSISLFTAWLRQQF
jgi:hypothetical protein